MFEVLFWVLRYESIKKRKYVGPSPVSWRIDSLDVYLGISLPKLGLENCAKGRLLEMIPVENK